MCLFGRVRLIVRGFIARLSRGLLRLMVVDSIGFIIIAGAFGNVFISRILTSSGGY